MGVPKKFSDKFPIEKVRPKSWLKVVALDGTGDFDDIEEAINALPSSGGTIFIKDGTYTITNTITIYKTQYRILKDCIFYARRMVGVHTILFRHYFIHTR